MSNKAEIEIGRNKIIVETNHIAKQAGGSVIVRCGETVVLTTATAAAKPREDVDFFPLMVDYRARSYAAGKFPGGYFKREGRPADKETLAARLIDRPIRPFFPDDFFCSTHIVNFILSYDQEHDPDLLAVFGASMALMLSDIPFMGPVSPVKIGRINEEFIVNPSAQEQAESDLNLTVVSSENAIVMVEGGGKEIPENVVVDALKLAFETAQPLNKLQKEFASQYGKPKREIVKPEVDWKDPQGNPIDAEKIIASYEDRMKSALQSADKATVYAAIDTLSAECAQHFDLSIPGVASAFHKAFSAMEKRVARKMILKDKLRNDGRKHDEIRKITSEVDLLPRTHGSALFTRGQTQALVSLTLGTSMDEQKIDDLEGETFKKFLLHYNFPPFSVGEAGFLRGPGRREIGHGALAERAILPIIPDSETFPYTIRIVSDIMESNGSSSMASVCGATLSLMDGGVPITSPVAGIAMGLVVEGDEYAILSDISGLEDHLGDMDFKVTGTRAGITAIQMDIKLTGFDFEIFSKALEQARQGRLHILNEMLSVISAPRKDLKPHAPRIEQMHVNPDKIAAIIGPGGKIIRALTAETGVKIDLEDDGTVRIASSDKDSLESARKRILALVEEAEIGKDYLGKVTRLENYGAFIEIIPGIDGLLHISRVANYHVRDIHDIFKLGDEVLVRVIEIDPAGKVKLSRIELIEEGKVDAGTPPEDSGRGYHDDRDRYNRGSRDRDRGYNRDRGSRGFNRDRHSRDSRRGDRGDYPRRDRNASQRNRDRDYPRRDRDNRDHGGYNRKPRRSRD